MKNIFIKISLFFVPLLVNYNCDYFAFAEELEVTEPTLYFSAVNAGYNDDVSAQNYDFFELSKTIEADLELSPYVIQYFNSSNNLAGEIYFAEPTIMQSQSFILGFDKSPQYLNTAEEYTYYFSSSGLASTAGRLRLLLDDEVADEICWGKISCEK
jgi:hypothetical protein